MPVRFNIDPDSDLWDGTWHTSDDQENYNILNQELHVPGGPVLIDGLEEVATAPTRTVHTHTDNASAAMSFRTAQAPATSATNTTDNGNADQATPSRGTATQDVAEAGAASGGSGVVG